MKINEGNVNLTFPLLARSESTDSGFGSLLSSANANQRNSQIPERKSELSRSDSRREEMRTSKENRSTRETRETTREVSSNRDESNTATDNVSPNDDNVQNASDLDNNVNQSVNEQENLESAVDGSEITDGEMVVTLPDEIFVLEDSEEVVTLPDEIIIAEDGEEVTIDEKEVIAQFAAIIAPIFNTTPEQIEEILIDGQINIEQLDEHATIQTIAQEVYEAPSASELLSVDNITQIFEQVTEVAESFVSNGFVSLEELGMVAVEPEEISLTEVTTTETIVAQQEVAVEQELAGELNQENQEGLTGEPVVQTNNADMNIGMATPHQMQTNNVAVTEEVAPLPTSPEEILDQVKTEIRSSLKGAVSEIRMIMNPESLGEVSLKIQSHNGVVTAQFAAQSQRVKEILEQNMSDLKEELEKQGIVIQELSVSVTTEDNTQFMENFEREQEKSQRRMSSIVNGIMNEDEEEIVPEIQLEDSKISLQA